MTLHDLHPGPWLVHPIAESDPDVQKAACWIEHVNDKGERWCVTATPTVSDANRMVRLHNERVKEKQ